MPFSHFLVPFVLEKLMPHASCPSKVSARSTCSSPNRLEDSGEQYQPRTGPSRTASFRLAATGHRVAHRRAWANRKPQAVPFPAYLKGEHLNLRGQLGLRALGDPKPLRAAAAAPPGRVSSPFQVETAQCRAKTGAAAADQATLSTSGADLELHGAPEARAKTAKLCLSTQSACKV